MATCNRPAGRGAYRQQDAGSCPRIISSLNRYAPRLLMSASVIVCVVGNSANAFLGSVPALGAVYHPRMLRGPHEALPSPRLGLRLRGGGFRGKADSWASMVARGTHKDDDEKVDSGAEDMAESKDAEPSFAPVSKAPVNSPTARGKPSGKDSATSASGTEVQLAAGQCDGEPAEDTNTYYFNSYSHFGIHEEMLKDEVRTKAYRDALLKNSHLLKGKTVLDVGCGTGILSMFAAQAGAKHVYAVDNSDMADTARQIIEANGFSDRITVYKAQVEEVQLPVEHVDCIVSEWMGYCLLYEAMFDSIIFARDKWLRPGGMLLPDKAGVYLCGIEDAKYKEEKIHFWDRVYGFDMSCVKGAAMFEPLVDTVDPQQICTSEGKLWDVDLLTASKDDMKVAPQPSTLNPQPATLNPGPCHLLRTHPDQERAHCS